MMSTNPKFSILSCYDEHGTIMLYNPNNTLDTHEIHIQNRIEIIVETFKLTLEKQSMLLFINLHNMYWNFASIIKKK